MQKAKCVYNGSKKNANEIFLQWEICYIINVLLHININSIVFIECYLFYL